MPDLASTPAARRLREHEIADWIARHEGMDASMHALLTAVVEGARDKALRLRLGCDELGLRRLLLRFRSKTGASVYDAATEVLTRLSSPNARAAKQVERGGYAPSAPRR